VATDFLNHQGAGDGVGLQPPERTGGVHSQETRLAQCIQDALGQASFPLCFCAVPPDDRSDLACGLDQRGVRFPMRSAGSLRRDESCHHAHLPFAGTTFPACPLVDGPIATSGGTAQEVSNLDFEVRNLDFTAGGSATVRGVPGSATRTTNDASPRCRSGTHITHAQNDVSMSI